MKKIRTLLSVMCFGLLLSCSNESLDLMNDHADQKLGENPYLITLDQAKEELSGIIGEIRNSSTRSEDTIERKISYSYPVKIPYENPQTLSTDSLSIYVINFERNHGFALMSSDRRFPSLFAFSERGHLGPNDRIENPGLGYYISSLKIFIDNIVSTEKFKWVVPDLDTPGLGGGDGHYDYGEWQNTIYPSEPLCPVKWGQNSPYNALCPKIGIYNTKTGCTATAVAQLMAVYSYPPSYNGYQFNWGLMTEKPNGDNCSQMGKENIARLMEQLGLPANLNISYGLKESGAPIENVPRTFSSFGYTYPGIIKDYSTSNVVDEVQKGCAVLASGFSHIKYIQIGDWSIPSGYKNGHLWLIHGLLKRTRRINYYSSTGTCISSKTETQWYTLCNWGWDGSSDGYYLSGVFDANTGASYPEDFNEADNDQEETRTEQDFNYQYRLKIITGIRK